MVFTYHVMQLVDHGKLKLDTPIKDDLESRLRSVAITPMRSLRATRVGRRSRRAWRSLTLQASTTSGSSSLAISCVFTLIPERASVTPGKVSAFYSSPSSMDVRRRGLGVEVVDLTTTTYQQLGMTRTRLMWRPDFATNLANGWNDKGEPQEHDSRSKERVAGSMDTTISDL